MMYDLLKEFIKPEMLVLIPVLYVIGIGLKTSAVFPDKYIPLVLGLIGVFVVIRYLVSTEPVLTKQALALVLFTGLTQGVLVTGASVYVNQLIKQSKE